MKSSEFISEAQVKPYQHQEFKELQTSIKFIQANCQQAIKGGMLENPLWRGMRGMYGYEAAVIHFKPGTGRRKSENTSNQYTALMSNSPYFKGWPKRDRSMICSTDIGYASDFGREYAILPFDNAKIGVCPSFDLWDTGITGDRLALLHERVRTIGRLPEFLSRNFDLPETYTRMKGYVLTSKFASLLNYYNSNHIGITNPLTPTEFIPYLFEVLNPTRIDMQLMNVKQFAAANLSNRECWLSADVVAIEYSVFNDIKWTIANETL